MSIKIGLVMDPLPSINVKKDSSFAMMLAAQKLYPGAQVVFPGSQEKNLKNFFISSMVYLFNMVDINKIAISKTEKIQGLINAVLQVETIEI